MHVKIIGIVLIIVISATIISKWDCTIGKKEMISISKYRAQRKLGHQLPLSWVRIDQIPITFTKMPPITIICIQKIKLIMSSTRAKRLKRYLNIFQNHWKISIMGP